MTETIQNKIIKNLQEVVELQEGIINDQKKLINEIFNLNRKILREWKWTNDLWLILSLMIVIFTLITYLLL